MVNCIVTSPPYWGLRDYGVGGQLGNEKLPDEYVIRLVEILREAHRVLTGNGTLWLNLGDSYARNGGTPGGGNRELLHMEGKQTRMTKIPPSSGLKEKDLVGIPWMVAFALRADGWYLRSDIIRQKPNPMPESVTDRPTRSHEHLFLLAKNQRYFYDSDAIAEPLTRPDEATRKTPGRFGGADKFIEASTQSRLHSGNAYVGTSNGKRNRRDVWNIAPQPYKGAHFATFPEKLVEPCILAGCPPDGVVLDPFCGTGTVGIVAHRLGRSFFGIDLKPEYLDLAAARFQKSVEARL